MNYKLSYYEDENIKIELTDEGLRFLYKSLGFNKEVLDFSLDIFRYVHNAIKEINND